MTRDEVLAIIKKHREQYRRPGDTLDLHEIITVDATRLAEALGQLIREEIKLQAEEIKLCHATITELRAGKNVEFADVEIERMKKDKTRLQEEVERLQARAKQPKESLGPLDQIAWDWGVRCFGEDHMRDARVRTLRMVEEAIEVAQSVGVSSELLHQQIDETYKRPVGEGHQELGGLFVTARMLCLALMIDPEDVLLREIKRCLSHSPEYFAQRNKEKLDLGLTG